MLAANGAEACALALAVFAGSGHAVALALRKELGKGRADYWREPWWWLGLFGELVAGASFAFATPWLPVQVLMPVVAVTQMGCTYLLGLFCLGEHGSAQQHVGLIIATAGVVRLACLKDSAAGESLVDDFLAHFEQVPFLSVNALWISVITCVWHLGSCSVAYALLSAYADGVQFLCTRTLFSALERNGGMFHPAAFAALALKLCCIVADIHFQQLAIRGRLSRIGASLPVFQNMMGGSLGDTFFGDYVGRSRVPALVGALLMTVGGLGLLVQEPSGEAKGEAVRSVDATERRTAYGAA